MKSCTDLRKPLAMLKISTGHRRSATIQPMSFDVLIGIAFVVTGAVAAVAAIRSRSAADWIPVIFAGIFATTVLTSL